MSFLRMALLLLLLTLYAGSIKAQSHPAQGEGIVSITIYTTLVTDTTKNENVGSSYRYFIKGSKILRKDSIDNLKIPASKPDSLKINSKEKIKVSFKATRIHPSYIIDLEKQQTFTFYKIDNQLYVSVDSLKDHFEDFVYKLSLKKENGAFLYLPKTKPEQIAGKNCYTAQWILNGDSNYFKYTEDPLTVKSPLNAFVPRFPYPILSLVGKVTHPKTGEFQGYATIRITELKEVKLNDDIFRIPKEAIIKYNVPKIEMLPGLDSKNF